MQVLLKVSRAPVRSMWAFGVIPMTVLNWWVPSSWWSLSLWFVALVLFLYFVWCWFSVGFKRKVWPYR